MQKITTHLWFDNQAEEAAKLYVSLFEDSRITGISRYGESGSQASGMAEGTVMSVAFQLAGQDFLALNGGPMFTFSPAISLVVDCADQAEVDRLWEALSADPEAEQCGWLVDRFGLSWQIVPQAFREFMSDPDPVKGERVMAALMPMKKIDVEALRQAYEGG